MTCRAPSRRFFEEISICNFGFLIFSQRRLSKKKVQSVDTSNSSTNDSVDIFKTILSRLEQLTKGVDDLRDGTSLMKESIDVLRDDLSLMKKSIDDTKAYLPSAEGSTTKCTSEKDVSILTDIVSFIVDVGQSKKSALVAKSFYVSNDHSFMPDSQHAECAHISSHGQSNCPSTSKKGKCAFEQNLNGKSLKRART